MKVSVTGSRVQDSDSNYPIEHVGILHTSRHGAVKSGGRASFTVPRSLHLSLALVLDLHLHAPAALAGGPSAECTHSNECTHAPTRTWLLLASYGSYSCKSKLD